MFSNLVSLFLIRVQWLLLWSLMAAVASGPCQLEDLDCFYRLENDFQNQTCTRKLGLALVGAGAFAAKAHLPSILVGAADCFQLRAVWSRTRTSAESLARRAEQAGVSPRIFVGAEGWRDLLQLGRRPPAGADWSGTGSTLGGGAATSAATKMSVDDVGAVEVLDLVLPIRQQLEFAEAALLRGYAVISEKPIAPDSAAGRRVLRAAEGPGRPPFWYVAENWRSELLIRVAAHLVGAGSGPKLGLESEVPSEDCRRPEVGKGAPHPETNLENECGSGSALGASRFALDGWTAIPEAHAYLQEGSWRLQERQFLVDIGVHYAAALRAILGGLKAGAEDWSVLSAIVPAEVPSPSSSSSTAANAAAQTAQAPQTPQATGQTANQTPTSTPNPFGPYSHFAAELVTKFGGASAWRGTWNFGLYTTKEDPEVAKKRSMSGFSMEVYMKNFSLRVTRDSLELRDSENNLLSRLPPGSQGSSVTSALRMAARCILQEESAAGCTQVSPYEALQDLELVESIVAALRASGGQGDGTDEERNERKRKRRTDENKQDRQNEANDKDSQSGENGESDEDDADKQHQKSSKEEQNENDDNEDRFGGATNGVGLGRRRAEDEQEL